MSSFRFKTDMVEDRSTKQKLSDKLASVDASLADMASLYVIPKSYPLNSGETSDRPRLQRMLDDANSKGIHRVKLPKQTFTMDGVPLVLYSDMEIESNGTILKMNQGTYANGIGFFTTRVLNGNPNVAVDYDATVPIKSNIKFIGELTLDGNMANVTCTNATSTCNGITAYRVQNFSVEDVIIQNLPGTVGGGYGIVAAYSQTVYIQRVTVNRTDRQNICIWETLDAHIDKVNLTFSYLRDNILISTNTPISFQQSYCTITNSELNNTSANGTHVIRFSGSGSGVVENCNMTSANNLDGVYVTDTYFKFVRILNNQMSNCSYGIRVESSVDKYVIGENNYILNCTTGISHIASLGVGIYKGNRIIGTTGQPAAIEFVDFATFSDNVVDGGTTHIQFQPTKYGHFQNNKIQNLTDASYAVIVSPDTTVTVNVTNNIIANNTANTMRVYTAGVVAGNIGSITSSGNANYSKITTSSLSANGTSTQYSIGHGMGSTPNFVTVIPQNSTSSGISYITWDATNIYVNYTTAPASGTNNLLYKYRAEI